MKRSWRVTGVQEITLATIVSVLNGRCLSVPSIQAHLYGLFGQRVSKVSLLKHFKKPEFGDFLRQLLSQLSFHVPSPELQGWLAPFSCVQMVDCSSWSIPETEDLCTHFPTVGGDCGGAGVKVGTCFDWTKKTFPEINIFPLRKSDTMKMFNFDVSEKSLHLFDLGFFSGDAMSHIAQEGGYFICRYHYGVVLREDGKKLNLLELQSQFDHGWDKYCTITNKNIPVRITIERLPDDAYEKRLKSLNRQVQRKSRKMNKKLFELARYNIFVSNIPKEMLCSAAIPVLYSSRWQIELVFKVCKSLLKLDHTSWRDINLIQNAIYAVFLTYQTIITWAEAQFKALSGKVNELSPWLIIKHFSWLFTIWVYLQMNPGGTLDDFLQDIVARSLEFCQKDDREKRPTTLRKLEQEISFKMLNELKNA